MIIPEERLAAFTAFSLPNSTRGFRSSGRELANSVIS
jgi:hypothetical protein